MTHSEVMKYREQFATKNLVFNSMDEIHEFQKKCENVKEFCMIVNITYEGYCKAKEDGNLVEAIKEIQDFMQTDEYHELTSFANIPNMFAAIANTLGESK